MCRKGRMDFFFVSFSSLVVCSKNRKLGHSFNAYAANVMECSFCSDSISQMPIWTVCVCVCARLKWSSVAVDVSSTARWHQNHIVPFTLSPNNRTNNFYQLSRSSCIIRSKCIHNRTWQYAWQTKPLFCPFNEYEYFVGNACLSLIIECDAENAHHFTKLLYYTRIRKRNLLWRPIGTVLISREIG